LLPLFTLFSPIFSRTCSATLTPSRARKENNEDKINAACQASTARTAFETSIVSIRKGHSLTQSCKDLDSKADGQSSYSNAKLESDATLVLSVVKVPIERGSSILYAVLSGWFVKTEPS